VGYLRARTLPPADEEAPVSERRSERTAVSVVIPCRDEAENLAALLPNLRSTVRDCDEIIVVDDESTDGTSTVAQSHGAVVVRSTALPVGWAGKSHACWLGASRAANDTLIFLDADVRIGNRAVDDLASLSESHPRAVVSVMPWHRTVAIVEQLSMMFNVVSSMVASLGASRGGRRVAYGPFLAVRRSEYMKIGGHSHESVRGAVVEDLALARAMPAAVAMLGRAGEVEYRMYPHGARQMLEGWTKNTAIGAASVPRWSALFIIAWIVSLCGGTVTSVWCYAASAVQVAVVSRRVGNFGAVSAALFPLHALVFVAVALRSLVRAALVGSVGWRGRRIPTR
jgi:4,4'-diaponeurosporenoate glycosyltransferase